MWLGQKQLCDFSMDVSYHLNSYAVSFPVFFNLILPQNGFINIQIHPPDHNKLLSFITYAQSDLTMALSGSSMIVMFPTVEKDRSPSNVRSWTVVSGPKRGTSSAKVRRCGHPRIMPNTLSPF